MNIQLSLIILGAINVLTLILFGVDKWKAVKKKFRIEERTLLSFCLCFGALGGFLGMHLFRHKTKKMLFATGVPLMLFAEVAIVYFLILR